MSAEGKHFVSKRVIVNQIIAFGGIIVFIWLDEVIDIPHLILGAESTPINWKESVFESSFIAILCLGIVNYTRKIFQRMKYLEGILPICASCKRIRDEQGNWRQLESYVHERSAADFSHGICPKCAERLYPEIYTNKEGEP